MGEVPEGSAHYSFRVWASDGFGKTDVVLKLKVTPIDEEMMFLYAFAVGGAVVTFTAVLSLHSMFTSSSGVTPNPN